jgi:transposase
MTVLASLITSFAALLVPDLGNSARLRQWITGARGADLPTCTHSPAALTWTSRPPTAALTLPHHNGRTEGVNTKTKMLKRQMYGRASFTLLRHRILLG